jgi:hypothetical protein
MTNLTRCALAVLAMSMAALGCNDDPPPGGPDAGYEWDGTYTPIEEKGDNIDTGPFAACSSFTVNDAGTPLPCGSPETFELSACDRSTLSRLSPDGIYAVRTRSSSSQFFGFGFNSFVLSSSGGSENVNSQPVVQKQVDGQNFYVAGKRTLTDGGTTLWAMAGCQAQDSQNFTGCYQTCTNGGARRSSGTFDGVRLQRSGEPETSGIDLLSESKVDLGLPVDVYVTKNHAYVVSLSLGRMSPPTGGLTVFDVTDKGRPVLRKVFTLAGDTYWNSVWSKGDALYVGSGNHGVLVFDITDPADPKMLRGVPGDSFDVHTIYVDGDRMYAQAAGANQVLIFDVSKPLEPVLLNRYTVPVDDNGFGYPHDSFAYQNRLYINQMGQGYYVVDVTDAADPKPLGSYTYDAQIYNPTHANAVGTLGGRTIAFEGGENINAHLRVLDVTDPTRIVKLGEHSMRPQASIHNMVLVGKRLYVAWYAEGLRVLDVSNPTQPREIAYANTFREAGSANLGGLFVGAIGIRVPGDGHVYVVDMARGLLIYREP